jgi:uncharacterized protein YjiS (DUF1127 family)
MSGHAHIYGRAVPGRRQNGGTSIGRRLETIVTTAFDRLITWQDRAQSRDMLSRLDDRMLQDIGIDRSAAEREAERPFWR